jgi:hypothetical protein
VTIVACGPCPNATGTLVYAVTVVQPVQSWTVVRSHSDFRDLGDAVNRSNFEVSPPTFPVLVENANTSDFNTVLSARNDLQGWLSAVLLQPSAYTVPEVSSFLTLGANTIPPQYGNVSWTLMQQSQPVDAVPVPPIHNPQMTVSQQHHHYQFHSSGNSVNLDDMEMADMFFLTDDENNPAPLHDDLEYEDDCIPPASIRYKPTEEAVSNEDEMELMQFADEVEMIEDIGSLAQSLGASHLGRSLQLQAELKYSNYSMPPGITTPVNQLNNQAPTSKPAPEPQQRQGLNVGGFSSAQRLTSLNGGRGGIGSAMEHAANNNVAPFNHRPPSSAPRLDSFKMIKVIGKGSFGKCNSWCLSFQ